MKPISRSEALFWGLATLAALTVLLYSGNTPGSNSTFPITLLLGLYALLGYRFFNLLPRQSNLSRPGLKQVAAGITFLGMVLVCIAVIYVIMSHDTVFSAPGRLFSELWPAGPFLLIGVLATALGLLLRWWDRRRVRA
jgi:hypothetical protein